jgi:hypothetical protein
MQQPAEHAPAACRLESLGPGPSQKSLTTTTDSHAQLLLPHTNPLKLQHDRLQKGTTKYPDEPQIWITASAADLQHTTHLQHVLQEVQV